MNQTLLDSAMTILQTLEKAGFCAYAAGGAIRDFLLKREPEDIDLVTDATPDQIESLFDKTIPVGKQFGVVIVKHNNLEFHVATFRAEKGAQDHRRPDQVFWSSAAEDAKRRDFTINGLFASIKALKCVKSGQPIPGSEIIDFVDGQNDIASLTIRFIGNPLERINEDALRILRAVRFKNTLGFKYDFDTKAALIKKASDISHISGERLRDELNKMLIHSSRADSLEDLDQLGILSYILPEVDRLHGIAQPWKFHGEGDVFTHTLLSIRALPKETSLPVVWGTLLHDIGKPDTQGMVPDKKHGGQRIGFYDHHIVGAKIAQDLLSRLHFPRDQIDHIVWLVENHMMIHEILEMREGRQKRWLLDARLPDLLELHRADASGKGKGRKVNLEAYEQVKKLCEDELAKPPPPPKVIDGNEIMNEFNLKPGPEVGRLLKIVEDAVWDGKVKTKAEALALLRKNGKIIPDS
jgi:poly(A) polymerase